MATYRKGLAGFCILGVALAGPSYAEAGNSQDSQTQARGVSGTAAPQGGTRVVVGRIENVDRANNLTIAGSESAGLAFDKFKIDAGTQVVSAGKTASAADLDEGQEVRASMGGDLHVQRIEILPSGNRGAPRGSSSPNR